MSFFIDSVEKAIRPSDTPRTITAANWPKAGLFLGLCSYAYESVATLFNRKKN
jgi:hypothetical protein